MDKDISLKVEMGPYMSRAPVSGPIGTLIKVCLHEKHNNEEARWVKGHEFTTIETPS